MDEKAKLLIETTRCLASRSSDSNLANAALVLCEAFERLDAASDSLLKAAGQLADAVEARISTAQICAGVGKC